MCFVYFYYASPYVALPLQVSMKSVKQLEQTKQIFENQLRELELRLEQEAKVLRCFHSSEKNDIICMVGHIVVTTIHNTVCNCTPETVQVTSVL